MSPHVRYDILLANLYFKNIHQSEDFKRRGVHGMNLESVVVGRWGGGGGGWGRKGGVGKPIHLSLQALAGATAAALQRRKRRRRRGVASAAHRHQSQGGKSRRQEKGGCCFEAAPPFTSIFVPESSSDASQSCRRQAAALPQRARPTKAPPPEANLILSLSLPRKLQRKFVQNTVIGAPTTNPRPPNNCGISFL